MQLPDGTTLMHGSHPYDPVKAREYYLKNRKLKGRKKGVAKGPALEKGVKRLVSKQGSPAQQARLAALHAILNKAPKTSAKPRERKLPPKELKAQRAAVVKQISSYKKRLSELNKELKDKTAKAKESERESKKPDSAAEKAEKARDSEKYRDKNKQKLKNKADDAKGGDKKESSPKSSSVESLKKEIAGVQRSLAAAVTKQRALG